MDDATRRVMGRFVDTWRLAGPALADQRIEELARLTDEQARRATLDLFRRWRPPDHDNFGAELVEQQRVFGLWRLRQSRTR